MNKVHTSCVISCSRTTSLSHTTCTTGTLEQPLCYWVQNHLVYLAVNLTQIASPLISQIYKYSTVAYIV